ncbi:hypothetical protein EC991_008807 [Linnemannia zychae]|nr:hypothetical protein EC991_008807 [Linnemannia zychae]
MSPIGGAAFAMKNFLRRKRGNTYDGNNPNSNNNGTGNDMESASPHDQSLQQQQSQQQYLNNSRNQQHPSLAMQSFILVGGVDTSTAPTVVYDIDPGVLSDTESVSRCQSPNLGPFTPPPTALAIMIPSITTTHSSPSPVATTTSFSQAMKSRFGRERSPTSPSTPTGVISPSSNFRRSRSRNPSAPSETLANGTAAVGTGGGGGLLAATAASMRKKLNRRSLSADSLPSSPQPAKTQQAQKLANAGGGVTSGEDISIGMNAHFTGSTVGGMPFRPPNGSSNTNTATVVRSGETVAFQDSRNDTPMRSHPQQGAPCNKNNTGGRKNKNKATSSKAVLPDNTLAMTSSTEQNSRDDTYDNDQDLDVGNSTLGSDASFTLDSANLSIEHQQTPDQHHRPQKQRKAKLGQNSNSPPFISPSPSTVSLSISKNLHRKSDSTLISAAAIDTPNSSRLALDTSLALEDLEKEIDALKTKEALLSASHISITAATVSVEDDSQWTKYQESGLKSPCREAKILLVSNSALPTQFYNSSKTRNVLRTYLTSPGLEFDEMIEYGFPSEAFMNNDDEEDLEPLDLNTAGGKSTNSQRKKVAAELAPSCRFLTLRITLTPWHARADESTLYGSRVTAGRQLQFKAMVNRFFSRSNNIATTMTAAPLSSPSSLSLASTTTSPKLKPVISAPMVNTRSPSSNTVAEDLQRSIHPLTSVTLSALDSAPASGATTPHSRPSSRAAGRRSPCESRNNSRPSSPGRGRSGPSSRRGSPATELTGPSMIPLLPSHILSPTNAPFHATAASGEAIPRIGRRLFSPTPSSTPSQIPVPVAIGSTSQPPRKGSLSALSLPINHQQQQQGNSSSLLANAPMVPPRRKGSTPALFFTPPPSSSIQSLESTDRRGIRTAGGRDIYPSPSSRAAQNYGPLGTLPPPRRPSDQSDIISTSLASARGLNAFGNRQDNLDSVSSSNGRQREKAGSFDTESHPKRHPRYPHSNHTKQANEVSTTSSLTPSGQEVSLIPRRQGSHDRLATFDTAPRSPTPGPILQAEQPQRYSLSTNGSEEEIYECYHVAGLDNIYKNATSRAQQPTTASATAEKKYHPLQTLPVRQGPKMFHISGAARGKNDDETRGLMASLAAAVGVSVEQTPMSAAPPRIQAKNQRRRGGGGTGSAARDGTTGALDRDHVPRQRMLHPHANHEEEEMDECEVHVGDISFEGAVDGLDDGVDEDVDGEERQREREREAVAAAAARAGGTNQHPQTRQKVETKQSKGRLDLNEKALREQFGRYLKTFRSAKEMSNSIGFGVTDEDHQKGIHTVADKQESMCTSQERDSNQQIVTTSQRRSHRLLEEEDEDEDEEAQDLESDESGELVGNNFSFDEVDPFDNNNSGNKDESESLNHLDPGLDTADKQDPGDGREDSNGVLEDDEISGLFISSPQVLLQQQQQKCPLTDTESLTSNKRKRTTDLQTKKLELEVSTLEWEMSHKVSKFEWEKSRETRKLELEQQKMEQETQLWKSEMETRVTIQTLQVIQTGLEKGVSIEQIRAILNTVIPRQQ